MFSSSTCVFVHSLHKIISSSKVVLICHIFLCLKQMSGFLLNFVPLVYLKMLDLRFSL